MNEKILEEFINICTKSAVNIILALLILVIGFKLVKFFMRIISAHGFERLDPGVKTFLTSFIKITLKIIIVISAAGVLGMPMTSFITILGSAGVAIGLALQGSLSNIAGGLIILIFKPFNVGQYISFSNVEGTVESIGIFYTNIVTLDNKRIVVPNSSITNQPLTNYTAFPLRRVDFIFCTGYESDIETVKKILLDSASSHPSVLSDPLPFAALIKHGESSLEFVLRIWCKTSDYWTVYFDMEKIIKEAFDKNNISIPYPQMDIHVKNG